MKVWNRKNKTDRIQIGGDIMKVATFKSKCHNSTCQLDIYVPVLSDFSYGEFIYGSIDGKLIKYYCGLGCKTWEFVDTVVSEICKDKNRREQGAVIQKIIGLIADRDDEDMYFTRNIYCPKCHTQIKSINFDMKTGLQEYPDLTFTDFERMNQLDKKNRIHELLRQ